MNIIKDRFYYSDGTILDFWDRSKTLHREDGPAAVYFDYQDPAPIQAWWVNGLRHREDGPAIELASGGRVWYFDGKLHRVNGPAVEYVDGAYEWYIEGIEYSEQEFLEIVKEAKALPLELKLTDPRKWVRDL